MLRTHHCGELNEKHIGKRATLCGWVDVRRDHGKLIFIDLRDRWGRTQIVFDPAVGHAIHATGEKLRSEFVLRVEGVVANRPKGTENPKLPTGAVEIRAEQVEILNPSDALPFELADDILVSEEIRLKYRYLDLRRPGMFARLENRYRITKVVRDYFDEQKFIEVETPMLTKSTPEGARDYLVPARLVPGAFYALPQSPQLFKQILMISGFDRYFQLARCLRDEDLRADRQPEHTQIDVEMSFVSEDDIYALIEGLLAHVVEKIRKVKIKTPFQKISYEEAMNRYGSDKPDLRFGLEISDLTAILGNSELKIFKEVVAQKGVVKGLKISGKDFSRSDLDELVTFAQSVGAKGLAWLKKTDSGFESPIAKFVSAPQQNELAKTLNVKTGETIFIVADKWKVACAVLGALRSRFGNELGLIDREALEFLWVVDFPSFEWNEEEKRLDALHHPFTSPKIEDLAHLEIEPQRVRARAYDVVLNGTEIGGGSIRIHQEEVQKKVFLALGIGEKEAEEKFGFLLRALRFGAPPHGGIAVGLDRLTAILSGVDSIREVIAFPKTQKGVCPLTEAPSQVYPKQLKELHLQIKV